LKLFDTFIDRNVGKVKHINAHCNPGHSRFPCLLDFSCCQHLVQTPGLTCLMTQGSKCGSSVCSI